MIIMKFGGTSVRDMNAIRRVVSIVKGRLADKPLVVVSALSKVTRILCKIADEAEAGHVAEIQKDMQELRDRHISLAKELLSEDAAVLGECEKDLESILLNLEDYVKGVCMIGELSPRSYARIVSCGELLSSKIVAAAMNANGLSCKWVDARKMVVTDCNYMSARPDLDMTEANIRRYIPEEAKGVSVILTQGFIASSSAGYTSVLGFEGSDYSAAIFGMALKADRVEIWTDVDGIRTADPRLVECTDRVPEVSYEEASEMAYLGARVLHPLTTEPARRRNIPVYVLNSANPSNPGSVVTGDEVKAGPKTVSLKDDIEYIVVKSAKIPGVSKMLSGVFGTAESFGIKTLLASVSESCIAFTMEHGQPGRDLFMTALREGFDVTVYKDKAQISVVGKDVVLTDGVQDIMRHCASRIFMTCQSPSLLSTSIVVDRRDAQAVVAALHNMLILRPISSL